MSRSDLVILLSGIMSKGMQILMNVNLIKKRNF